MKNILVLFCVALVFSSCKKTTKPDEPNTGTYYYPPLSGDAWDIQTAPSIGWDEGKLQDAFDYAGSKNTFGLIILHQGKIVKEQYWNNWTKDTRYYLASAGKSVVGFVAGIAQQHGIININDKTSKYIGPSWTSLSPEKENLITIRHQLTMTTGLDDAVPDPDCLEPACLIYKADARTRWAYHNAPYRLLQNVLSAASGKTWNAYCKEVLFDKIGIKGFWLNYLMFCTTRDAARFGSLILRKGEWNGEKLLTDQAYFTAMTNSSQTYNLAYGYLWWLNGKSSFMLPQSQLKFPQTLVPNAPNDMIMALGKDDKKIYVIPSLEVVVIRLGDDAGTSAAGPSSFDNELWGKMKLTMRY